MKYIALFLMVCGLSSCSLIFSIYRTEISPHRWRGTYSDYSMFLVDTTNHKKTYLMEVYAYRWEFDVLTVKYKEKNPISGLETKHQAILRGARGVYAIEEVRRLTSHFKGQKITKQYTETKNKQYGLPTKKAK